MPKKKDETINFESKLNELDKLVEKMERGGLSLEESLKSFEKGVALTRESQQALKKVEQKVEILLRDNGDESLEPYHDND